MESGCPEVLGERLLSLLLEELAPAEFARRLDEDRCDTYMRVTEGTATSDFMNIRLALGIGLGGLVAQTAVPQWTANYLEDRRYLHAIDGVVANERLIAILGVPLKVGRRVIGVLFVADCRPRSFAQGEVALLASLAARGLGGGQQQILALGRGLMTRPRVLLLDEPSEGIQPSIVDLIAQHVRRINEEHGITVVLVKQNPQFATKIADHAHLLDKGRSVRELSARDVLTDRDLQHEYLGV